MFAFMNGSGRDTIENFQFGTEDNSDFINTYGDTVSEVTTSGDNVVIKVADSVDKLTIVDGAGKKIQVTDAEGEKVYLVDENEFTYDDEVTNYVATGKDAAVSISADYNDSAVNVNLSDEKFSGKFAKLDAGAFDGDAYLVGNSGNDTIVAAQGNSSLWGVSGNNTLIGGDGEDLFAYGINGDTRDGGKDVIENYTAGQDSVWLFNVNLGDLSGYDIESDKVVLTVKNGGSLTINKGETDEVSVKLADGDWTATYDESGNAYWRLND